MSVVLFVKHLDIHVAEADVRALFEQAGRVEGVFLMRNDYAIASGLSDTSVFIEMADQSSAIRAIDIFNDQPVLGMARLAVRVADPDAYESAVAAHEDVLARRIVLPEPLRRRRDVGALLVAAVAIWAGAWWWPIPWLILLVWVGLRSNPLLREKSRARLAGLPWNLGLRLWPPTYAALWIALSAAFLWMLFAERANRVKILPIGLILFALTILIFGYWWRPILRRIDAAWPRRKIPDNTVIIHASDGSIETADAPGPEPLSELIPRLFRRLRRRRLDQRKERP
jgi:hypothetical protein